VNNTSKFAVIDPASSRIDHTKAAAGGGHAGREKTRLTKGTGQSIKEGVGRIAGPFSLQSDPEFLKERLATYEAIVKKREAELAGEDGA
jgi:hypothetical protein